MSGIVAVAAAAERPHGTRMRYRSGCRCLTCRLENARRAREGRHRRAAGDWRGFVPADRARGHILDLQRQGLGGRAVAEASDVALSGIVAIRTGKHRFVRADLERRILAVDASARLDRALVDARPTWRRIERLKKEGFTQEEIARRLGLKTPRLYFRRDRIHARTAHKVERFYERVMS